MDLTLSEMTGKALFVFRNNWKSRIFLLGVPLILSAFVHLWNPLGFPGLHPDEGHYIRRAMLILSGNGPQERTSDFDHPYDHPYFGQILLAGAYYIAGFPNSLHFDSSKIASVVLLYEIPRIFMGVLAVIDTFIIYCITSRQYNQRVAFMSSLLFSVMPFTWILRRIYLDNLLMPFLLSSIFFALYVNNLAGKSVCRSESRRSYLPIKDIKCFSVIISGIFFGIAIFTKIPVITMLPLVLFLVYKNTHSSKNLLVWIIPAILIPAIWPFYSLGIGHFADWLDGIIHQANRAAREGLVDSLHDFLVLDPVSSIVGVLGTIYAIVKRDIFILLWLIPFLIFSYAIGWIIYFHIILIFPAICIAAAVMMDRVMRKFGSSVIRNVLPLLVIGIVAVIGFASSLLLVVLAVNTNHFEAYAHVLKLISDSHRLNNDTNVGKGTTLLIGHWIYFLMPKYVLNENIDTTISSSKSPINFSKVSEKDFIKNIDERKIIVVENGKKNLVSAKIPLTVIYNKTSNPYANKLNFNQYPYTALENKYNFNFGNNIVIKTN